MYKFHRATFSILAVCSVLMGSGCSFNVGFRARAGTRGGTGGQDDNYNGSANSSSATPPAANGDHDHSASMNSSSSNSSSSAQQQSQAPQKTKSTASNSHSDSAQATIPANTSSSASNSSSSSASNSSSSSSSAAVKANGSNATTTSSSAAQEAQHNPNSAATTPAASAPPTPAPAPAPAPRAEERTLSPGVSGPSDIGTEDGGEWDVYEKSNNGEAWIGVGEKPQQSWLGLRFLNVNLPDKATISSAKLILSHPEKKSGGQWIRVNFDLYGETESDPKDYAQNQGPLPSQRKLTTAVFNYKADEHWLAGKLWEIDVTDIMRELVQKGFGRRAVSLIAKGGEYQWGRKFFQPFGSNAPKLVIKFTTPAGMAR